MFKSKLIDVAIAALILFLSPLSIKAQWYQQNIPSNVGFLLTTDFANSELGVAGGWQITSDFTGRAIYTTDGGQLWLSSNLPYDTRSIVKMQMINPELGFAGGAYNLSSGSIVGNKAFNRKYPDYYSLLDQYPNAKKKLKQCGLEYLNQNYGALFLKTTDGGTNWISYGQLPDSLSYLFSILFLDSLVGYATADGPIFASARILKTTDGGNTWEQQVSYDSTLYLQSISFGDYNSGIAVGYSLEGTSMHGVSLRTTNGGNEWHRSDYSGVEAFTDVFFSSPTSIIISSFLGEVSSVMKSIDGGITWSLLFSSPIRISLNGVRFYGNNAGVTYGSGTTLLFDPYIAATTDGGVNWEEQIIPFPLDNYILYSGDMVDEIFWFLCGGDAQNGLMLHTSNGGVVPVELTLFTATPLGNNIRLQWETATETNNSHFEVERNIPLPPPFRRGGQAERGGAGDGGGWMKIGRVEGNGTTTEPQTYFFEDNLEGIHSSGIIYYRLKQIDFDGSYEYSNVVQVEIRITTEFSLEQNYPNPFNPTTKIKYAVPDLETHGYASIQLKIYDILGNEITTLVDEQKSPGTYEVEFDGTLLSSGIYFYQLKTDNFIEMKKMLLMK